MSDSVFTNRSDAAVALVISQIQQHNNIKQIDQCWELLEQCLCTWVSLSDSVIQRRACFIEITKLKRYKYNKHKTAVCRLFGEAELVNGDYQAANYYLSKVICSSLDAPELHETVSNLRNSLVVRWSFRMLNDLRRNLAYCSAISSFLATATDPVVLDLGAGTGLLSLYASKSGARKIITIEQDDIMYGICKRVTSEISIIDVIHCSSGEFDIENTHVDVVVTETLDSIGIGEGIVSSCNDLAVRSSNQKIKFIPSHITLLVFLIHSETLHKSSFCGKFRTKIGTTEEEYCCEFVDEFEDLVQMSEPTKLLDVELGKKLDDSNIQVLNITVTCSSWCDGVCSYFIAHLCKDFSITSAPKIIKTDVARMECWEQGFHPLPRRYLKRGETARIKVVQTRNSVILSWSGSQDEFTAIDSNQIKLLNCNFAQSGSNELLNLIPKVVDISGLLISDPLDLDHIKCTTFFGYVIHSKKLQAWTRVHPQTLYLGRSSKADLIATEMNQYQTLVHQNIPWNTLEHTKLSKCLHLLQISRDGNLPNRCRTFHYTNEFQSLSPHLPTALVFWIEIELTSGVKFTTSSEALWRPAAIIFQGINNVCEKYSLSVGYKDASLSAHITQG